MFECTGIFGVPKQVVAGAAYDALMKFDEQLQLGMQHHLQRINYVNIDAETTAVFIQTFSGSVSRDQGRDKDWRPAAAAAASQDEVRAVRRSKSVERQPAKQAFLQSTWKDDVYAASEGRRRRRRQGDVGLPASSAAEPHSGVGQTHVGRTRTQHLSSSSDNRYEYWLTSILNEP